MNVDISKGYYVSKYPDFPDPTNDRAISSTGIIPSIELSSFTGPTGASVSYNPAPTNGLVSNLQNTGVVNFSQPGSYTLTFSQPSFSITYETYVSVWQGTFSNGQPTEYQSLYYNNRTATYSVNVLNGQTITPFSAISSKTPGAAPFLISAPSSDSGLPVTVSVLRGPATISGTPGGSYTVTLTGRGNVVLEATQAGNSTYFSAAPVTISFYVQRSTVFLHLSGLNATYDGNPHAVSVSVFPDNFTPTITYNGSQTVPTNAGRYTVAAGVDTVDYYGGDTGVLYIKPAPATITLSGTTEITYDGDPHGLTASTTPSGLPVLTTYNGSPTPPTTSGRYSVLATITDPNYSETARAVLNIGGEPFYYNNALGNGNLGALGNYWTDSAYTVAATTLPTANDFVYIDAIFSNGNAIPIRWKKTIIGKFSNNLAVNFYLTGNAAGGSQIFGDVEFWNGAYIADINQGSPDPGFTGSATVNYPCPCPMPNLSAQGAINYVGYPAAIGNQNFQVPMQTLWIDGSFHATAIWSQQAPNGSTQPSLSLGTVKEGDDLLLQVSFHSTIPAANDPQITSISCKFKDPVSGSVILQTFNFLPLISTQLGTNPPGIFTANGFASYLFYMPVASQALQSLLGNFVSGVNSSVTLQGEVEWSEINTTGVGPDLLTQRSQNFPLTITRSLTLGSNLT
jgi:hypothetical protein